MVMVRPAGLGLVQCRVRQRPLRRWCGCGGDDDVV